MRGPRLKGQQGHIDRKRLNQSDGRAPSGKSACRGQAGKRANGEAGKSGWPFNLPLSNIELFAQRRQRGPHFWPPIPATGAKQRRLRAVDQTIFQYFQMVGPQRIPG